MSEKAKAFRRRLLGGFDRRDVIEYIEKLASERSRWRSSEGRLESECEKLRNELEYLRAELCNADACIREISGELIPNAEDSPAFAEDRYLAVRDGVLETSDNIRTELGRLEDTFDAVSSLIDLAAVRFEELKRDFTEESAE